MLSFERLKELKSWVSDLRKFGVSEGNEIIVLIDEATARQSVTSEDVAEAITVLKRINHTREQVARMVLIEWAQPQKAIQQTVDLAITALQAYQPWVSVSERLPEKSLDVLTFRKNGNSKVLRFENDCKWYDSYNEWETDVTHWCPLPEPPKGE